MRGSADDIQRLAELADRDSSIPFRVGVVQITEGSASGEWTESRVLVPRSVDTVEAAVRNGVGAVVLMGGQVEPAVAVRRMVWRLEGYGIATSMIPVVADLCAPEVRPLGDTGMPLLSFHSRDLGAEVGLSKVVVDKVLAMVGLLLVLPVVIVTSLAVKLSSPGPVFFRQVRVGRNGQPFEMLKFRTMYSTPRQRRAELEELNRHSGGTLFKISDDPRMTRVGRVLRRFSLDELPQLFNVARGQMSLVGPRPPLPNEVANYPVDAHRRFRVRPGPDRALAGQRAIGSRSGRVGTPGHPLRRAVVPSPGPQDPGAYSQGRGVGQGRVLMKGGAHTKVPRARMDGEVIDLRETPGTRPVLIVHSSDDMYGADRMVLEVVGAMTSRDRARVVVWLPADYQHGSTPLCEELEARGIAYEHLELPVVRRRYLNARGASAISARVARARRRLAELDPSEVILATSAVLPLAPFIGRRGRSTVVLHMQEVWSGREAHVLAAMAAAWTGSSPSPRPPGQPAGATA